jgi:hypothetical protein
MLASHETLVNADWRESAVFPTVEVNVTNRGNQRTVLVDIEIYDSAGNRLAQQFYDNQQFATGQTRQFTGPVPPSVPSGTYTVKVGIFAPSWASTLAWNNSAATYTI